MIKKTYYNLPKEKQNRIFNAIKNEFSKYPKEKVSINRIVKDAGISRGSFYQYFDDKLDLIELLTGDLLSQILEFAKSFLIKYNGNIFAAYSELFSAVIDLIDEKDDCQFFKNIFANLKVNGNLISDFVQYRFDPSEDEKKIEHIIGYYVNPKHLNCRTKEEISYVFNILNLVIKNGLFNIFVKQNDKEAEIEIFNKKLELLKNGFASNINTLYGPRA